MTEEHEAQEKRSALGLWLVAGGIGALLWLGCISWYYIPWQPAQIEFWYSRGLYKVISSLIVPVTDRIPFSLILTAQAALLVLALFVLLRFIVALIRKKESPGRKGAWKRILLTVFFAPLLPCWFLLFWGIGYGREPMETRLHLSTEKVREEELEEIGEQLLAMIERDRPRHEDERNVERAIRSVASAMEGLVLQWEERSITLPRRVKATPPGLLLVNGTAGICSPFTLEAHVDGGLPDTTFVAIAAHELGHIAGVCDEGETNLIGFAAGLHAEDSYARYCVALDLFLDVTRQLPGEKNRALANRLPGEVIKDLIARQEATQRYRIDIFHRWSWRMYNHYLKSQGVKEGVRSYGRGVQLVVKAWRAGLLPLHS